MKAPISWLAEHVDLPAGLTDRALADALVRVGMEVEGVESGADALSGPIVVGRVLSFDDEPQKNGKTIRWCQVDVGEDEPRGIVCGAHNFAADDLVVVSLPGAVLPGGFAISARKTYGHVSDGMICSVRELGIGDEHDGILVLPTGLRRARRRPARRARAARRRARHRGDHRSRVLPVDPRAGPRGRGRTARRRSTTSPPTCPAPDGGAYDVRIDDPTGCDRFSARDGHRARPDRADAGLDGAPAAAVRHALDLARRRRHQLRDARDRPATARVRPGPARPARSWCAGPQPGEKLTTLDDVGPHARPRRPGGHRRHRRDRARRRDGRRVHRDRPRHHRHRAGGGALGPGRGVAHRPAAPAAQRGRAPLRARRRPGDRRRRTGPLRRAARRPTAAPRPARATPSSARHCHPGGSRWPRPGPRRWPACRSAATRPWPTSRRSAASSTPARCCCRSSRRRGDPIC